MINVITCITLNEQMIWTSALLLLCCHCVIYLNAVIAGLLYSLTHTLPVLKVDHLVLSWLNFDACLKQQAVFCCCLVENRGGSWVPQRYNQECQYIQVNSLHPLQKLSGSNISEDLILRILEPVTAVHLVTVTFLWEKEGHK